MGGVLLFRVEIFFYDPGASASPGVDCDIREQFLRAYYVLNT